MRCAELNYVSDVDVIFVADAATDSNLALATRVAGAMMRFASETFFEVDAALRPEESTGNWCARWSHVAYYNRWAKTWEFQALLKARPAAGDTQLGEQYIDALMPMVWTACEREDFVPGTGDASSRRAIGARRGAGREIKLGTGGLRDVEFAVQLLQLVHGRNDESLHVASTVDALAALGGGYVGRDDAANMTARHTIPPAARAPAAAAAAQAHPHAARDRRRRGDAMAGPRCAPAARRPARRAGCAARRAQAAKPAGVEAARQALYQPLLESVGQPALPFGGMTPRPPNVSSPHWDMRARRAR